MMHFCYRPTCAIFARSPACAWKTGSNHSSRQEEFKRHWPNGCVVQLKAYVGESLILPKGCSYQETIMTKPRGVEAKLNRLHALRNAPISAETLAVLSQSLRDASNLLVAEAAKMVGDQTVTALAP